MTLGIKSLFKIDLNPNRVYGLDILRAIAILIVVVEHGMFLLPKQVNAIIKIFTIDGVSMFFVLSGFLIGGILIKLIEQQAADKNLLVQFWKRRWYRTVPNYMLVLVVLYLVNVAVNNSYSLWDIKSYFIFSQNLYYPHPEFFGEAWSLSVEEWFYILIPMLVFLLIRVFKLQPKQSILLTGISVIVVITCIRFFKYNHTFIQTTEEWNLMFRKQVFTRLDSLM